MAFHRQTIRPADEERLIMQKARHNPTAFAPLYERYFDRVYAYCWRRTSNAQEAEDLCSQIFTQALTGLPSYRGGLVAAWLFQIAHNVVVNHYRRRKPMAALDDFDFADEASADAFERAEAGNERLLQDLIDDLPDEQRNLLSLTLDAGLTSKEIGAALGKSPVAVRVQVHRILKKLRERYLNRMEALP